MNQSGMEKCCPKDSACQISEVSADERYMQRCLDIASHASSYTAPNPMVGAVVVCNDMIIGEGFHSAAGRPHAEVEAINSIKDKSLLSHSTLYVNLEPCCHYGKTPPCTELIIKHHIPKVVVGSIDSNPQVGGKGIRRLREAGCEVIIGVLEKECRELNRRFFTFHGSKRPYILLKWAQTSDGFMDIDRSGELAESYWITNNALRIKVHQWRAEESAIWIGPNTLLHDNPQLNVRYCSGRQPLRIMHCSELPTESFKYHLFDKSQKSLVFNAGIQNEEPNLSLVRIKGLSKLRGVSNTDGKSCGKHLSGENIFGNFISAGKPQDSNIPYSSNGILRADVLKQMLDYLYEKQVLSVMVEGGCKTLQSFIDSGLWDEARVLVGNCCWGKGLKAPEIEQNPQLTEYVEDNKIIYYRNK